MDELKESLIKINMDPSVIHSLAVFLNNNAEFKANDLRQLFKEINLNYTEFLKLGRLNNLHDFYKQWFGAQGVPFLLTLKDGNQLKIDKHQIKALRYMKKLETLVCSQQSESIDMKNYTYGIQGGILVMKMGLGKTLTTLTHVLSSYDTNAITLVLCPLVLLNEWKTQGIEKFFSSNTVKVLYLHKSMIPNMKEFEDKNDATSIRENYQIVLTTYDYCAFQFKKKKENVNSLLYSINWTRIVCDESQLFANPSTLLFKSVCQLKSQYKWCLSGTPIRNKTLDLWSQLQFCGYNVIKKEEWKKNEEMIVMNHDLKRFLLVIDYDETDIVLPAKTFVNKVVRFTEQEAQSYREIKERIVQSFHEGGKFSSLFKYFTTMRMFCVDPTILEVEFIELLKRKDDFEKLKHQIKNKVIVPGSKLRECLKIIKEEIPVESKVIIFSFFSRALHLLKYVIEHEFKDMCYNCVVLDGKNKGNNRNDDLIRFRTNPAIKFCLISYKVGSQGINLIEANHCIFLEPFWTPAVHEQALMRCWRRGQTKQVHCYFLTYDDSFEQMIYNVCLRKTLLSKALINHFTSNNNALTQKESVEFNSNLDKHTLGMLLGILQ